MHRIPDKRRVQDALLASMRQRLATIARVAEDSRKGATHEENRSEGDKDMRATEQSYVARGQAMRVEELAEQIQRLEAMTLPSFKGDDAIKTGALVVASVDEEPRLVFVVPWGGGTEIIVDSARVTVITPNSPVGRELLGKQAGDSFEVRVSRNAVEWEIERVI